MREKETQVYSTLANDLPGESYVTGYFQATPKSANFTIKQYVVFQGKSSSCFTMFDLGFGVNNFQGDADIKSSVELLLS